MIDQRGTSRSYSLRRLARDAPALHAEVLAGRLSAHAAMVQAGFTAPRFTVRVTSPDAIAAAIREHIPPELLPEVVERLTRPAAPGS